ncbi:hypothetical protein EJV47_17155 [Hymenobacter gummosus]|uniref:Uncharacterized protein n=1 Tax=Hymenobacter gummosus TaxID=1776032 RepID=A0A431U058_9BACT|nr:hypothetical protein [Hymenobacter gummosus]RTQ48160.1 hypothetical protein EJV47_17155 [Hymenobacter gummosus]
MATREAAAQLGSDAEFHAFLLLQVWYQVLRALRQLQLKLLGYTEPPGMHKDTAATQLARLR